MTDLKERISELLDAPSTALEGFEDTEVQWASSGDGSTAFVKLGEWTENIYLDPTQALALLDWLKEQRENLEELQEALHAQKAEADATKEQREAERINALKAKHSEAVTAWQDGGCKGPCPTFEEIANPRVELIRKYPCWELLRKRQIDATPAIPLQPGVETPIRDAIKDASITSRELAEKAAIAELAPYFADLGGYHGTGNMEVLREDQEEQELDPLEEMKRIEEELKLLAEG
jgi:hypothetical protein